MNNHDILSDIFSTLRISGQLYFRAELRGDFAVAVPQERRRIRFHLLRRGRCWVAVPGADAVELSEGDLAIVPNGAGQVLSAVPGASPVPLAEVMDRGGLVEGVLSHGSGGRHASLLCGFCHFDEAMDHPVLTNLPGLLVVRLEDLGAEPWAAATLRLLSLEADLAAQGSSGILARLLEIVLIQALRRMTPRLDSAATGFIAALSDAQLSKALHAMHGEPQLAWTIRDLAKLAGMSRASFAERFTSVVGVPPMGYLTSWRLMKARGLLVGSDLDMAEIAERCGYASVPSFTRRFKTAFGLGPGTFRRVSRSGSQGG